MPDYEPPKKQDWRWWHHLMLGCGVLLLFGVLVGGTVFAFWAWAITHSP